MYGSGFFPPFDPFAVRPWLFVGMVKCTHTTECEISGGLVLPNDWHAVCWWCRTKGCRHCGELLPNGQASFFEHSVCIRQRLDLVLWENNTSQRLDSILGEINTQDSGFFKLLEKHKDAVSAAVGIPWKYLVPMRRTRRILLLGS